MPKRILLSTINPAKLRKGIYKKKFPEFYALKKIIENNSAHAKQNVFDHSLKALTAYNKILSLDFLKNKQKRKIKKYLVLKTERYSRKDLLIAACLLHDIGKKETLIRDNLGQTATPNHEIISSLMVANFASLFALGFKARKQIEKIIFYHTFAHQLIGLAIKNKNKEKYFNLFFKITKEVGIGTLLLAYADLLASDLKQNNPQEFKQREKTIIDFLNKYEHHTI